MPKRSKNENATVFTVEITVHDNWTKDGFNLMRKPQEEKLKDCIMEKMLGFAKENEVKVETVKAEIGNL